MAAAVEAAEEADADKLVPTIDKNAENRETDEWSVSRFYFERGFENSSGGLVKFYLFS